MEAIVLSTDHEVEYFLIKSKCWLVEVSLYELITLTMLGRLEEDVAGVEDCIAQQYSVYLLDRT